MLPLLNSIAKSGRSHGETGDAAQGSEAANEGKFVWYEWWGMIHLKNYIIIYIYMMMNGFHGFFLKVRSMGEFFDSKTMDVGDHVASGGHWDWSSLRS